MGIGDVQYTVLEIVNEVQRKLGLTTTSLAANKLSTLCVDFLNDICDEMSDFGNWQEMLVSANVTAASGQADYSVNTSANIKNIADIFFSTRTGPVHHITIEDMRIMTRVTTVGTPTQYTVFGVDGNGNPQIRVRPIPGSNEDGDLFYVLYYMKPPKYTTSDGSTRVPLPGSVVVNGVLSKAILYESGGSPTDKYTKTYSDYLESRKEALNRFNGDSGWDVSFTPSLQTRRRR